MTAKSFLTALSPIEYRPDDPEDRLASLRDTLLGHQQGDSPFADCPMVHMARLQIIDQFTPPMGDISEAALKTRYLLFVVDMDGSVDDFLDCLYRMNRGFVQHVWGRCVGYPAYEGAVFFRRYIRRCMFEKPLGYAGFPENVDEILKALACKQKLADWIAAHQGLDDAALRKAWRADRQQFIDIDTPKPGKL